MWYFLFFLSVIFYFFAINSKILRRYLNTLLSFSLIRTFVHLKLTDTIEYMNRREQSREDPDETVRMHRLNLTCGSKHLETKWLIMLENLRQNIMTTLKQH